MIVRNPFAEPWSSVGLEVVVIACGVLTFVHALRVWRRERALLPLFTWIAIVSYGLVMEIVSYETIDSFTHGPFTVMLYRGKLPLYIVFVYPALLYTGIATARRLGLSWWAEPLVAGLAIVLLDVPFDVLGATSATGWWSWSPTDPNLRERWCGVPLTSYYWHIAFGACLALLARSVDRWLAPPKGRPLLLLAAPLFGAATIVLGALAFLPFHVLKKAGLPDAGNLALLVCVCAALAVFAKRGPAPASAGAGADRLLLGVVLAYHAFFLIVLAARGAQIDGAGPKAAVVLVGTALSLGWNVFAQYRGSFEGPSSLTPRAGVRRLWDRDVAAPGDHAGP